MKEKRYVLALDAFDMGQLLDGITQRANAYRNTENYHETGDFDTHEPILEVNDAEEARKLAEHYERIAAAIELQMKEQDAER